MAQAEIEKRYASQLGIGFQYGGLNKNSISTSVISIHNFLMNFLKFYDSALYAFSGELLTVYDYAHQKIHQSKDLGKFTLSGKILQKNGLLACEMRHDVVKIFDSKTCN